MRPCTFSMCLLWAEDTEHREKGSCSMDNRNCCLHYQNQQKAIQILNSIIVAQEMTGGGNSVLFNAVKSVVDLLEGNNGQ